MLLVSACSKSEPKESTPPPASNTTQTTTDPNTPKDGGTITISTFSDIVTVNPIMFEDTASGDLIYLIFSNLYDLNAKGEIEVNDRTIAAELPKVSDDQKSYTIKLKSTGKWSDGKPITADDVVFTFTANSTKETASPNYSYFAQLEKATAIDPTTVELKLKDVDARFVLNTFNTPIAPAHVFKDVPFAEIEKQAFGKDPKATVTSGPYKWVEWQEKQFHRLEANPDYWGKKPHIAEIVYKIYASQNTEVQALVNGETDFMETVPVALLDVIKQKEGLKIYESPGQSYDYIVFNFDGKNFPGGKSFFEGKKTRQAINYAINRKGMVDSVLQGHGTLLNGPFLPGTWAFDESAAKNFEYNVETAKKLLAEDGWKAGSDGVLAKDGQRFEFDLMTNAGNVRRESYLAIVQQNLAEVGIKVNLKPMDFSALVDNHLGTGEFQTVLLGWSLTPEPDCESIFSSAYFPPAGQNSGLYKNEKTDKLWVDSYRTSKQDERRAIYAEILKEFGDDPPYVFIAQQNTMTAFNGRVHWKDADKPVHMLPYGYFFHIFEWWVD